MSKAFNGIRATIEVWISHLHHYDLQALLLKPDAESWSMGQLYMHLIEETRYYVDQMQVCLTQTENEKEEMNAGGRKIFSDNELANEKLKGDPQAHANMPEPRTHQALLQDVLKLQAELEEVENKIIGCKRQGKTPHPGFGYFNASEWLRYAGMHFRHHLLQKHRIDEFLKKQKMTGT